MVYADPVPPEYASGDYYNTSAARYYLSSEKLKADYSPVRFSRELRLFRHWCRRGEVLDVGCSSGAFLFQLGRRYPDDYVLLGTDVSQPPLEYAAAQGVPVLRDDFLTHDFGANRFDAITFWAVLEHLAEPGRFLAKAKTLLRQNGLCFVLVPNFDSLAVRILRAHYRYIYAQHLNYFSPKTLRQFAHDWKVEYLSSSHFNPFVIWQDWRGHGRDVPNEERGALLTRTTRLKSSRALAPVRWAYSAAERLLAGAFLADNLVAVLRAT